MVIMRAKEILELLRQQPFQALRIHISDGASYDVPHPEMMMVTSTLVMIAQPPLKDGVPTRWAHCDPMHVTGIEPLTGRKRTNSRKRRKS